MTQSFKVTKGSKKCQDDCTNETFVRKTAVLKIDWKYWYKNSNLDHFYVIKDLQEYTAIGKIVLTYNIKDTYTGVDDPLLGILAA